MTDEELELLRFDLGVMATRLDTLFLTAALSAQQTKGLDEARQAIVKFFHECTLAVDSVMKMRASLN